MTAKEMDLWAAKEAADSLAITYEPLPVPVRTDDSHDDGDGCNCGGCPLCWGIEDDCCTEDECLCGLTPCCCL